MTTKKYSIITIISVIALIFILIYTFCISSTKAYADEITEAVVSTDTSTTDNTTVVPSTRRAPVSIAVYSNEVTESSDTYDYTTKVTATAPVLMPLPDSGNETPMYPGSNTDTSIQTTPSPESNTGGMEVIATRDPRSTAAPDATPEPDIITYEPTVAPAYQD